MEATDVSIRGDLVITRGFALSDWYLIVRKGDEISRSFLCDAAVEGPSLEMRQLADAIVARKRQVFRRCAVDATEELVRL